MRKLFVILIVINCVIISTYNSYAKYTINYNLECFDITIQKDEEPPKFNIEYSTNSWTNQDVIIKVKFSEEVTGLDGFEYRNGYYVKVCSYNEKKEIKVYDLAGNESILRYEVNCIDKEPPIITGIENNVTYSEEKYVTFIDDKSGIKKIEKEFYGDLLIGLTEENNNIKIHVLRHPKNIKEYRYYRVESQIENYILSTNENIVFNNIDSIQNNYYVVAIDNNGNTYKSNIIEENNLVVDVSKYNYIEDKEQFSKNGIYDINISDNAGNEILYTIKIDL